jgi:nucleoside-triphosphatase THEP1
MEGRRIDAWVERAVPERIDLLIIDKFGREEVHGRGLRSVIAEALIAEIPLLIGVSTRNLCDFLTFVGDSTTRLNAIKHGAHHRFQPRLSSVQA